MEGLGLGREELFKRLFYEDFGVEIMRRFYFKNGLRKYIFEEGFRFVFIRFS